MSFAVDFFFSSRRRHTRLVSDWSSDVCSSDLDKGTMATIGRSAAVAWIGRFKFSGWFAWLTWLFVHRSEERRVGKECRSRWWPCYVKEKQASNALPCRHHASTYASRRRRRTTC